MRRDLRIMRLGHAGDFLGFQNAANAAQRHLQNAGRTQLKQSGKLIFGGKPFARRNRNGGLAGNNRHLFRHFGRDRLFKPKRVIGFQLARQPDGT